MDNKDNSQANDLLTALTRIAEALESQAGTKKTQKPESWAAHTLWVWQAMDKRLHPVTDQVALPLSLLVGVEAQTTTLMNNTQQFANGFAANNALLWGARGTGKSALVKSVHAAITQDTALHLIEIYRDDMGSLPALLDLLRGAADQRFILFCDDLSFDEHDSSYKSLKAVLDGGIQGRPDNVILYATSNRRHLLPRNMIENERSTAIHKSEAVEEKISLSDRFGLWLGFYHVDQPSYLEMIEGYADHYDLDYQPADALEWAMTRGNRSGRVAWQYIQHIAGQQKKTL